MEPSSSERPHEIYMRPHVSLITKFAVNMLRKEAIEISSFPNFTNVLLSLQKDQNLIVKFCMLIRRVLKFMLIEMFCFLINIMMQFFFGRS